MLALNSPLPEFSLPFLPSGMLSFWGSCLRTHPPPPPSIGEERILAGLRLTVTASTEDLAWRSGSECGPYGSVSPKSC